MSWIDLGSVAAAVLTALIAIDWWRERVRHERARGKAAYEAWAAAREVQAAGLSLPSCLLPYEQFNWDGQSTAFKEGVLVAQKQELLQMQIRNEEGRRKLLAEYELLRTSQHRKDYLQ